MLKPAVTESIAAIEEDGAEVIVLGCSAAYWMQPLLQKKLAEIGWDVPVLEGYRCALGVGEALVGLGVDAPGPPFSRRGAGEGAAKEGVLGMQLTRRSFLATTGVAVSGAARAAGYPSETIRIVI